MPQTIAIVGSHSHFATLLTPMLEQETGMRVISLDDQISASNGNHLPAAQLIERLRDERVDTVIIPTIAGEESPTISREYALVHNILIPMQIFGACVHAGVTRIILRSSTLVYGAHPTHPMFLNESHPVTTPKGDGLLRNYIELDRFATSFAQSHPRLAVVVLRCASMVGSGISSPLARYLTQPAPAAIIGFNPLLQVVHPHDAARAFVHAVQQPVRGPVNIAAHSPLTLMHAIRLAGRQPLLTLAPLLAAVALFRSHGTFARWPLHDTFLYYPCVAEIRHAHDILAWHPHIPPDIALRQLRWYHNDRPPAESSSSRTPAQAQAKAHPS